MNENLRKLVNEYVRPEKIGFGSALAPIMIVSHYQDGAWSPMETIPYGPLQIDPAAKVLHYAQEIFEGLKAYKNEEGDVYLFRPEMNAKRFNMSARRLAMPEFPEEDFVASARELSAAMADHISTAMNSSLYLRPFMIGTEPTLGVKPSATYTYCIIASLSETYFARPSVNVLVEDENCRAAPGGVGHAKTGANYGASLKAFDKTRSLGLDQTLWLDAMEKRFIEELSGMNFFAVIGDELVTPALTDTILAGITRDSILQIAPQFGLRPVERKMDIEQFLQQVDTEVCSEAFACGTAAVITPIESLQYRSKTSRLLRPEGEKALAIKDHILRLQRGLEPDELGWTLKVN